MPLAANCIPPGAWTHTASDGTICCRTGPLGAAIDLSWLTPAIEATVATAGISVAAFQAWSSYDLGQEALRLQKQQNRASQALAMEQLSLIKKQLEMQAAAQERREQNVLGVEGGNTYLLGGGILLALALIFSLGRR